MTDQALVQRAQAGDQAAFDELLRRYQRPVYGFVYHLIGSADAATDVTQEVFVRAWRYLRRFDARRPFRPWLYAIASNRASSHRVREQARETLPLDDNAPEPVAPDDVPGALERVELSGQVMAAVRQLSAQQRDAVVLVELEGRTATEAAELMGIEPVTVRQHLFRAKKRLRALLAEYVERGAAAEGV